MADKIKIIWNPISGSGIGQKAVPEMIKIFDSCGIKAESAMTEAKGDAREFAFQTEGEDYRSIIALGGDGTINEVINGLGPKGVPLAVFPAGTGNVLWHEIKTPRKVNEFCEMVVRGESRSFDVGEVNGRRFICMAGAGFDASVVDYLEKLRWGNMVMAMYAVPIAQTLINYDFPKIQVEVDGETVSKTAGMVIVGNIAEYGGPINYTLNAVYNDGLLDVCLFERLGVTSAVKHFAKVLFRQHLKDGDVKYVQGREIRLTTERRVPLQVDGDGFGTLPAEIKVNPGELPIIMNNGSRPE